MDTNKARLLLGETENHLRFLELELLFVDEVGEYDTVIAESTIKGLSKSGLSPEGKVAIYRYKFLRIDK